MPTATPTEGVTLSPYSPDANSASRPTAPESDAHAPCPRLAPARLPAQHQARVRRRAQVPPRAPTPSPTLDALANAVTDRLARSDGRSGADAGLIRAGIGLVILEPIDGATVADRIVLVRGLAQPGSTVTRDVPMWFDEHVAADSAGRWSFAVSLNLGGNMLSFRVGDDVSTARTLTLYYQP